MNMSVSLVLGLKPTDGSVDLRTPTSSLLAALLAVRAPGVRDGLEAVELSYTKDSASLAIDPWPPFHFILAGVNKDLSPDGPYIPITALLPTSDDEVVVEPPAPTSDAQSAANSLDSLTVLVSRCLDKSSKTEAPPLPFARQLCDAISANVADPGWFVLRFVYTRRDCGPLHLPLLSAPTQRFQLANFFDSDAPARPIRITLPLDTSPAGLRKHQKNTAFVISDMLCGQIQRAKGLGFIDLVLSVLPWPLHKDLDVGAGGSCKNGGGLNIGMICSLSIPIITIVALILLIIFVTLFDLIFRWLPFFIMCFPVPGLKGKK
jgi:hypothetical protein